jgi:hypothetical protein
MPDSLTAVFDPGLLQARGQRQVPSGEGQCFPTLKSG